MARVGNRTTTCRACVERKPSRLTRTLARSRSGTAPACDPLARLHHGGSLLGPPTGKRGDGNVLARERLSERVSDTSEAAAVTTLPCVIPTSRCPHEDKAQLHHVLGRGADGRYLEPQVVIPLCQPDCHQMGIHALLRGIHLDGPMPATPGVVIGRIACTLGWLGGSGRGEIALPASLLSDLGGVLGTVSVELREQEAARA
jgi:hypothetical protein